MEETCKICETVSNEGLTVQETTPAARPLEVITAEIWLYKQQAGAAILEIGRRLNEAKAQLSHGEWLPWLEEKVEFSEVTAQRFMRLAREYENPSLVTDLGAAKALALLALPDSERESFAAEKHSVNGKEKAVADMTKRELEQAIRERNEARAAAEKASAEQKAAETARDEMARQMKMINESLKDANRNLAQRQKELDELRSQPVEVAVEQVADPAAIEAARKEAIAEMQAKVDKAKAARDKADEKRKAAEDALAAANAKLEALAKEEKKAAISSDKDLATFEVLFVQAQEQANKLRGALIKIRGKGNAETAQSCQRALAALAGKIKEAAEA